MGKVEIKKSLIIRVGAKEAKYASDQVACEEPLEIKISYFKKSPVQRTISVTMRTPGDDKALALGFLFSEGIIDSLAHVQEVIEDKNSVMIQLDDKCKIVESALKRNFHSTSSCGVCGKANLKALGLDKCKSLLENKAKTSSGTITLLEKSLCEKQDVFASTGGLHACGLYSMDGTPILVKEDIGRHNALDKLIGHQLASDGLSLSNSILMLSGRVGYEMIQKSIRAGIPILAAIGAPTSMAVEVANHFAQTLIGFLRNDTFNIYSHPERIIDVSDIKN